MTHIKTDKEVTYMRKAGEIVALAHKAVKSVIQEGITTKELNQIIENVIISNGATPSFKGLYGFPSASCISLNTILVHGIPDDTKLQDGDIVSIDIGACYHGYHGDSAWTYAVGNIHDNVKKLLQVSKNALFEGLKMAKPGNHLTDISHAIGEYVYSFGFSVPRDYSGHGIGTSVHEDPIVPNFGPAGHGILLKEHMTLAIEPMVLAGRPQTKICDNGVSIVSRDNSLSAHFEHTIVITQQGYEILTTLNKEERPDNG